MIENEGKYYLYRHIRLDTGEPFYIGIGTKNKKQQEYYRANSKYKRNSFWKNITNKTDYEIEILLESNDYEFIKQKEIEFIALYGRRDLGKGTLVNMTDGGDGMVGLIQSEESINKRRKKLKGRKQSKEVLEKLKIIHSESKKEREEKLVGTKFIMNQGCTAQIVYYIDYYKVGIIFTESGIERECSMRELLLGRLKDYFYPSVCGIGYLGNNKVNTKYRNFWTTLLINNKDTNGISKEWCNLQNFSEWMDDTYKPEKMEGWVLRTNIFNEEIKECNPDNCYFLPREISKQFDRTKGYSIRKDGRISVNFLEKHIGYYKTIKEAVEKYKGIKKEYINKVSEKYKEVFSEELYSKILNYEIRIKN